MHINIMQRPIATRLKAERLKWGMTQGDLAPILLIRHATQLSRIERGLRKPSAHTVLASAMVFGLGPDRLYPGISEQVEDKVVKSAYTLFRRVERKSDPASRKKQDLLRLIASRQKVVCK